ASRIPHSSVGLLCFGSSPRNVFYLRTGAPRLVISSRLNYVPHVAGTGSVPARGASLLPNPRRWTVWRHSNGDIEGTRMSVSIDGVSIVAFAARVHAAEQSAAVSAAKHATDVALANTDQAGKTLTDLQASGGNAAQAKFAAAEQRYRVTQQQLLAACKIELDSLGAE